MVYADVLLAVAFVALVVTGLLALLMHIVFRVFKRELRAFWELNAPDVKPFAVHKMSDYEVEQACRRWVAECSKASWAASSNISFDSVCKPSLPIKRDYSLRRTRSVPRLSPY